MIPDFQNTNDAVKYGEKSSISEIPILADQRQNYIDSFQVLKCIDGDLNLRLLLACKAQFCREAIETIIERKVPWRRM